MLPLTNTVPLEKRGILLLSVHTLWESVVAVVVPLRKSATTGAPVAVVVEVVATQQADQHFLCKGMLAERVNQEALKAAEAAEVHRRPAQPEPLAQAEMVEQEQPTA